MFRDKKNSLDWDIATIFERALVKSCISYKKTLASFLTFIMLLSIFNPFLVWATDESLLFDLTSEGTEETLTEFENNDDAPLGDIQIESVNEPSIVTTLTDLTTKADKLDFDLWVKDADGEKIDKSNVQVTNNNEFVPVNWDDAEKTSYTLDLNIGDNLVKITVNFEGETYTREFMITREEAEDGEVIGKITFSLEASTIGLGYLIEPIQVDLHKGENAAQTLLKLLDTYGYNYDYTGSLDSGFYLSYLLDNTNTIYKTTVNPHSNNAYQ